MCQTAFGIRSTLGFAMRVSSRVAVREMPWAFRVKQEGGRMS
jgi:hypothetical protein